MPPPNVDEMKDRKDVEGLISALGAFGHKNAPAKALRRSILIGSSGAVCAVAIPLK
ncbi:MAG: hypothetical protein ACXW1N_08840 [Halobacteriota archaeon]